MEVTIILLSTGVELIVGTGYSHIKEWLHSGESQAISTTSLSNGKPITITKRHIIVAKPLKINKDGKRKEG